MTTINDLVNQLESFANGKDGKDCVPVDGLSQEQFKEAAQAISEELIALQAIYGEDSISLFSSSSSQPSSKSVKWKSHEPIRLILIIPLNIECDGSKDEDTTKIRISANLPPGYPMARKTPQLQLLSHYIGSHGVDHTLFGRILRIFIQSSSNSLDSQHVKFEQGNVALFDGIEKARELVETWYEERENERKQRILSNDHLKSNDVNEDLQYEQEISDKFENTSIQEQFSIKQTNKSLDHIKLFTSPAITERKSTFVGHAATLYDPSDVQDILAKILQDRRIARASHPTMYAWVCKINTKEKGKGSGIAIHRDCDDDGETAAGGRLAHLLDLCKLENAIVIVTRWYGGIHLGSDRFKLINRAARDALELARLVDGPLNPSSTNQKGQKH